MQTETEIAQATMAQAKHQAQLELGQLRNKLKKELKSPREEMRPFKDAELDGRARMLLNIIEKYEVILERNGI